MLLLFLTGLLLAIEATLADGHRSQQGSSLVREAAAVANSPEADLGYAIYRGAHDRLSDINVFRGYADQYALHCLQ